MIGRPFTRSGFIYSWMCIGGSVSGKMKLAIVRYQSDGSGFYIVYTQRVNITGPGLMKVDIPEAEGGIKVQKGDMMAVIAADNTAATLRMTTVTCAPNTTCPTCNKGPNGESVSCCVYATITESQLLRGVNLTLGTTDRYQVQVALRAIFGKDSIWYFSTYYTLIIIFVIIIHFVITICRSCSVCWLIS